MKRLGSLILILLTIGVIYAWISWLSFRTLESVEDVKTESHEEKEDEKEEKSVAFSDKQIEDNGITFQKAGPGTLSVTLSTRGKIVVHPDAYVHVLPKAAGVAKEALKNIGEAVKEDEIVAVLESKEMAEIKANYLAAVEKEKLTKSQLDRETTLHDKKISAEQDFLNAKSANQEAKINLQLALQKLKTFGLEDHEINVLSTENSSDLRRYEIRSPLAGTIINRHITKGEYIDEETTIYEIADLSNVWVEAGLFPGDVCKVANGHVVEVTLPSQNLKSEAKVIYTSPIIQEDTITAKAIAELPNAENKWRPGTFVNVNICTNKIEVPLLIPQEAIQNIEGVDVVFVKTESGFDKRVVQTGKSDQTYIEIISGLSSGEVYAGSKTFILKADLLKSTAKDDD